MLNKRGRYWVYDGAKGEKILNQLNYTPAQGTYYFFYKYNLYFFERKFEPAGNAGENLTISCFGRNPDNLKTLLDDCRQQFNKRDEGNTVIYRADVKYHEFIWARSSTRPTRPFESVVLDDSTKDYILNDLRDYFDPKQQQWYAARGIPYRRGYLLYGSPGVRIFSKSS